MRVGAFPSTFTIRMVWLNGALGMLGGGSLITTILIVVVVTDITQESERYMIPGILSLPIEVANNVITSALLSSFIQEHSSLSVLSSVNQWALFSWLGILGSL